MSRDGIPWVLVPLAAATAAVLFGWWYVAIPFALLAAFMAYFFRDPERVAPDDDSVVVSPADGRVTRVEKAEAGNPQSPTVVSIFLSPFDVHINRSPIAGEITNVTYTKGRFLIATKEEASVVNEQNSLTIRGEGMTVVCKQIAGVVARRIVCWKRAGDRVKVGERFGLIKFSSRTDLILPPEVDVISKVGERVRGGQTVVGRLRDGR
jgi:phosphatidylserine decarboxylase